MELKIEPSSMYFHPHFITSALVESDGPGSWRPPPLSLSHRPPSVTFSLDTDLHLLILTDLPPLEGSSVVLSGVSDPHVCSLSNI